MDRVASLYEGVLMRINEMKYEYSAVNTGNGNSHKITIELRPCDDCMRVIYSSSSHSTKQECVSDAVFYIDSMIEKLQNMKKCILEV